MFKKKKTEILPQKDILDYSYEESRVLYKNDFEQELRGWKIRGPEEGHFNYDKHEVKVELTAEEAHSGSRCMKISGRLENWNGAEIDITKYLRENKEDYEAMVWVKLREDAVPCMVNLSFQTNSRVADIDFPEFSYFGNISEANPSILSHYRLPVGTPAPENEEWQINYPPGYVTDDGWVLLRGKVKVNVRNYEKVFVYIETSVAESHNQDIYVDDFVLLKGI